MGRILLHVGTHKTGTTSIQRFADRNREQLGERGLSYPSYRAIGLPGHYAHLDVAKTIIGARTRLGSEGLEKFCAHLREDATNHQATLISAEPFWRGGLEKAGAGNECYWPARHAFIDRVASHFPPEMTEIVIVCRGQADLLESLFQEEVKVNRWRKGLNAFRTAKEPLFDYLAQAEAWARRYPSVRVLSFEALQAGDLLVKSFFSAVGVDVTGLKPSTRFNTSIYPDFVTALRMLNRSALDERQLATAATALLKLQEDPIVESWPRRSLWGSRQARDAFDAAFHQDNDKMLERFGDPSTPIRARFLDPATKFGERMTEAALSFLLGKLIVPAGAETPLSSLDHQSTGGARPHEMLGN